MGTRCNSFLVPKKSFSMGVQTWPYESSMSIVVTNRSIERISVLVHIFGSPFSKLILTSCCSTTCKVARPFQSIMWKCLHWLTKSTSPPSHCNALFICFFIFLVNTIVIFHQQKWFTSTINYYYYFSILNKKTNCKNNETFWKNYTHFSNEDK